MGFYYTADPENAVPGKSCATTKTHVPGSPVKERGYRYYSAEIGRWCSRDPIWETGFNISASNPFALHQRAIHELRIERISDAVQTYWASYGLNIERSLIERTVREHYRNENRNEEELSKVTLTPLTFAANNPIDEVDILGLFNLQVCLNACRGGTAGMWSFCRSLPQCPGPAGAIRALCWAAAMGSTAVCNGFCYARAN